MISFFVKKISLTGRNHRACAISKQQQKCGRQAESRNYNNELRKVENGVAGIGGLTLMV